MTGSNQETVRDGGHDILDDVDVIVRCDLCQTTYPVRASVIRDSQRVLAERGYDVWFYDSVLGSYVPGVNETLQPAASGPVVE